MKMLNQVAFVLLLVGGLNWGLVGLLNYNLVDSLLGGLGLAGLVYTLVGVSAVYIAATEWKMVGKK
ncbi:DUF378 domain-containing protein [Candidatus Daviesbacteria bacterium RIFCSPHIGHO2_02_FULL_39_12]|uniref:DUF378 domain-containing protein n=2 Tax=Candidatus Daviesiibacteriota TaxID=1752718 RepID=A0A1F5JE01_9BACT|nr:MAG: DUF378 domain-containing protein [Candidatus Daviesbacteria bacterium RIFCSPHIGHO2_02_FULL_39_12]OGE71462.1 MAG: DUF378 domain-containing protein [Candidatus Daviesbacteria bacterium RIFCSPLOWO2_02_FULL_38_15]